MAKFANIVCERPLYLSEHSRNITLNNFFYYRNLILSIHATFCLSPIAPTFTFAPGGGCSSLSLWCSASAISKIKTKEKIDRNLWKRYQNSFVSSFPTKVRWILYFNPYLPYTLWLILVSNFVYESSIFVFIDLQ